MAALAGFKEDPQWIAKQMTPAITPSEAKQALEDLEKLGLLIRDGQGKLRQADSTIMTSDEVTSASIAQFHREMMRLGARSIDTVPSLEREISAVTISVSPAQAKEVKKLIQEFRKKVLEVVAENSPETDRVYELNFQLFPLTKRVNKEVA
jgi:uncharacterized protein (TIGR02147 family)